MKISENLREIKEGAINLKYPLIEPIVRYLQKLSELNINLNIKSPSQNVTADVEEFNKIFEEVNLINS
jgi:hypothetical protein